MVVIETRGRAVLSKGVRVRVGGLVYVVTSASPPDELDDDVALTECDVQPADAPRGTRVVDANLVGGRR